MLPKQKTPLAYILSSKHRTALCSSVFKAFNKGPARPRIGQLMGGLGSAPLTEDQANIGQAGLCPWDLLLPGALGHDRLLEHSFLSLFLSTVRSVATKRATNNKGSPFAAQNLNSLKGVTFGVFSKPLHWQ